MDKDKLEKRIIGLIKESLKLQKIDKKIIPIKLIENRERYYLVQCKNGDNRKTRLVFIRYDKWLFYIHGLSNIPKIFERRKYNAKIRIKPEQKPKKNTEKEEERIERIIDKLLKKERKRERQSQ